MTTDTDRKFIADPNRWPNWPILPVVRYKDGVHETAIIVEHGMSGDEFKIARGANMWDKTTMKGFVTITIDEIVAEGWEVD